AAQDFVRCKRCQTIIQMNATPGATPPVVGAASLSHVAVIGMVLGLLSLLTACVFFVSLPLSIAAVIMGHLGLQAVRKNRPHLEGRWQAITALASGYSALLFSITILAAVLLAPRWAPPNGAQRANAGVAGGATGISGSAHEAFKGAEYEIASKRDKPAGRGNSPEAVALASEFSQKLKEVSDVAFTSGRRPLLQLSDGEYLTFCELHEDRCLFLVHVPSYRKFTGEAKKALAEISWSVAQATVADKLPPDSKLGVGLRGVLTYGDIMLGTCAEATDDEAVASFKSGKTEDLLAFFEPDQAKPTASTIAGIDRAPEQPPAPTLPTVDAHAGKPNVERIGGSFAEGAAPGEGPLANMPISPFPQDLASTSARPLMAEGTQPKSAPENALASRDTQRERRRPTATPDFENRIAIQRVRNIENDSWAFMSLAFSPDGKWLAGGKLDEMVYVFDTATGDTVYKTDRLRNLGQVTALAFSSSGEFLVASGYSGQTFCWKVAADGSLQDQESLYRFDSDVQLLITSPKHPFFMGAARKGTIAWQAFGEKKSQPRLLQEFPKNVQAIWLPTNNNEALATDGQKLVSFSLRDGQTSSTRELGIKSPQFAAFSPSGKRLVVSTYDTLHLFDLGDAGSNQTIKLPRGERVHSLRFHPKEHWIAAGMRGKVAIFDFEKAELIAYADAESISYQSKIAFSSDGKHLATSSDSSRSPIIIFQMPEYQQ
ncbi:MAG: hypothetical protein ACTHK7_07990, partial [Aureliella sp.]